MKRRKGEWDEGREKVREGERDRKNSGIKSY